MQGTEGADGDLPTDWEGRFFNTPFRKAIWLILQPIFYGCRPFYTCPQPVTQMEIVNNIIQIAFDYFIYTAFGPKMLFYLLGGSLLSMGLHPVAGHFISEHIIWVQGHETYSYTGPLNWITWNVGYHVAHHDFPSVPGKFLPKVHEIAPEFYDNLPIHTSWVWCLVDFITNPKYGPYARLKRDRLPNITAEMGEKDD